MHLIIPFASSSSEGCVAAKPKLQLPHLQKLLGRLCLVARDSGDELSLSPPHERALARTLGLAAPDGQIAWAAWQASQRPELARLGGAWCFVSLCHWQVNTHTMVMSHLPLPDLSVRESADLLAAMRPYFEEDGIALHEDHDQPGRWLAQGEIFATLASASPDRVLGRSLELWMPTAPQAAPLRRLQNEMQMLLYTHPVNAAREARGAPPANSFWLHGSGVLSASAKMPLLQPVVADSLAHAALAEDWPGWQAAWQELDASQIKALWQAAASGEVVQLTLCGERHAITWQTQKQPFWRRFMRLFDSQPLSTVLSQL